MIMVMMGMSGGGGADLTGGNCFAVSRWPRADSLILIISIIMYSL